MGFNAISIWDFRKGETDYYTENRNNINKIDAWGRIYKNKWYTWDGVFKNEKIKNSFAALLSSVKISLVFI